MSAFPVYTICFIEIVHDKCIGQTENSLERSFVKHGLNQGCQLPTSSNIENW